MLAGLRQQAREITLPEQLELPHVVAERRLLSWVRSRPDRLPPIPWSELDRSEQQPAGRPVFLEGETWRLKMKCSHWEGKSWVTPGCPENQVTRIQLLDWFPLEASEEELVKVCRIVVLLQDAADGVPEALETVLRAAGLDAAADFVHEHGDGEDLWVVPPSFPSPRTLLQAAFEEPQWEWERGVLQELCEGGEHWEPWPHALPVPR
jgi:hypothetical protein